MRSLAGPGSQEFGHSAEMNALEQPEEKVLSAQRIESKMVRPERFELPTFWFVARRSIQLS